jgi:uncharacterized protein
MFIADDALLQRSRASGHWKGAGNDRQQCQVPDPEWAVRARQIAADTERTWALVFETGDEVVSAIEQFAAKVGLSASRLSAIGAFQRVKLGYFDVQLKAYEAIEIQDQVEVLSLLGDIALDGQNPKLHAHCVVGHRDGSTRGGHLMEAVVRPTLEVLLIESPAHLRRFYDAATGLALIRLDADDADASAEGPLGKTCGKAQSA